MPQKKHCVSCEGEIRPLTSRDISRQLTGLDLAEWQYDPKAKSLKTLYLMADFNEAVKLIQRIARAAETENHHPDLHLTGYRKLEVVLSTHAVGGVTVNDLILAGIISGLPKKLKPVK